MQCYTYTYRYAAYTALQYVPTRDDGVYQYRGNNGRPNE